ncbi:uncharacterized protein [Periplaneta americana]|uniref:uncharacterized protein isoform X2 n=1 Tax=Periplaneta americana TaxID=6978 RepID=UPI0037E8E2B2
MTRVKYCGIYLIAIFYTATAEVKVLDSGVFPIRRGDVGIVFYVTAKNGFPEPIHVFTKMVECCEKIANNDTDCEYPHNRLGFCIVSVWYRRSSTRDTADVSHRISFDTHVSRTVVPPVLKDYYKLDEVKKCTSIDLDPLDSCLPVNCHMKYAGSRNYYDSKWQRCRKVPTCISDDTKELPDVAYAPTSNTCKDLEAAITDEDLHVLAHGVIDSSWRSGPAPHITNMRCHHGHMDNTTGFCVCDEGWTSSSDQFNPSTSPYHMCTMQVGRLSIDMQHRGTVTIVIFIGALAAALLIVACTCTCYSLHQHF